MHLHAHYNGLTTDDFSRHVNSVVFIFLNYTDMCEVLSVWTPLVCDANKSCLVGCLWKLSRLINHKKKLIWGEIRLLQTTQMLSIQLLPQLLLLLFTVTELWCACKYADSLGLDLSSPL